MAYQSKGYSDGNRLFNTSNPLVMLLIINVLFFILLNFIKSIYTFSNLSDESFYRNIYNWFAMPADLEKFSGRPWTILTMQFTELKVMGVISHLFWLWVFGEIIQDLVGTEKIIPIYLYCGIAYAISVLLLANLVFTENAPFVFYNGPSAIILGIAVAATTLSHSYRFFVHIGGGIPLWVIAAIYFTLFLTSTGTSWLFIIPGIISALMGFSFIKALQSGIDLGDWMNRLGRYVNTFMDPKKKRGADTRNTAFYKLGGRKPFERKPNFSQQRVDALLDKINQMGYDKLTEEEKEFLKRASKEEL